MRRSTTTVTVRDLQDRSMGHTHRTRVVWLADAKRAASWAGLPLAWKGRNVTGAAAKAAASAAPAAWTYPATPTPTAPTPTASIRTNTTTPRPRTIEPRSPLNAHRRLCVKVDAETTEDGCCNGVAE